MAENIWFIRYKLLCFYCFSSPVLHFPYALITFFHIFLFFLIYDIFGLYLMSFKCSMELFHFNLFNCVSNMSNHHFVYILAYTIVSDDLFILLIIGSFNLVNYLLFLPNPKIYQHTSFRMTDFYSKRSSKYQIQIEKSTKLEENR